MALIIVESPTKAKTITGFLKGKHKVLSSFGHIRDLPKKELGVDIEKNFEPKYSVSRDKLKVIKPIKESAKKETEIIFATDEDREGEAISWHLAYVLKIDPKKAKRIVFHEITNNAITKALENPKKINLDLVNAQQARRILDRLVGYKLSPFLWKKIHYGLSAGRVQSVAVRLIVEREKEIKKFQTTNYFTINASFSKKDSELFDSELFKIDNKNISKSKTYDLFDGKYKSTFTCLDTEDKAKKVLKDISNKKYFVSKIEKKESKKNPSPPFVTSSLQREASWRLGFSAKKTMRVAQQLYEGIKINGKQVGIITYMRTDSFNLANTAISSIRNHIKDSFGDNYLPEKPNYYKAKSKGAQEAHEAIRPVNIDLTPEKIGKNLDASQLKLYRLIWQRTAACQMTPQILDSTALYIDSNDNKYQFKSNGVTIKFDGWTKVYDSKTKENRIPNLKEKDDLGLLKETKEEHKTTPPPRYNEGSLIKALEKNGIGRPSTYASIITTIQTRKYVEKNDQRKFIPTEEGFLVNDLLVEHFKKIVSIDFTSKMESNLDEIAEGSKNWQNVVENFYNPFEKNLKTKEKDVAKVQKKLDRTCPECGSDLVMKYGRFGKFIACSDYPKCKYTERTEEEKKLEEEVKDEICDKCGAKMVLKQGRYGPFLGCSNYPECKNIKKIEKKTGIKCDKCGKGELVEKMSKRGKFYGCSRYPKCKNALWKLPEKKAD